MSTTTRKKPIDLSKCKVGQRVKLRNGRETTITIIIKGLSYPWCNDFGLNWRSDGRFMTKREDVNDIVALLPLPKKAGKKKAPERLQKALAAFDTIDAPTVRRCIKLLEGLLKP